MEWLEAAKTATAEEIAGVARRLLPRPEGVVAGQRHGLEPGLVERIVP
jgi:hypothetical protein